jgi:hypothetical protein
MKHKSLAERRRPLKSQKKETRHYYSGCYGAGVVIEVYGKMRKMPNWIKPSSAHFLKTAARGVIP